MLINEKKKLETIIEEKEHKNQQSQYHFKLIMEENERLKCNYRIILLILPKFIYILLKKINIKFNS